METETEIKRKTETTALNKTIPNYKQETEIKRETEMSLRQQHINMKRQVLSFISFQFISSHKMNQSYRNNGIYVCTSTRYTGTVKGTKGRIIKTTTTTKNNNDNNKQVQGQGREYKLSLQTFKFQKSQYNWHVPASAYKIK